LRGNLTVFNSRRVSVNVHPPMTKTD